MELRFRTLSAITLYSLATSCALLKNGIQKTTIKTENTTQKFPTGTIETSNISTTVTTTKRKGETIYIQSQTPTAANPTNLILFKSTIDKINKDGKIIQIISQAKKDKIPTSYTQQTISSSTDNTTDPLLDCDVKTIKITAQSSTFMNADYDAQGQHIYPGAIYDYTDFKSGNYKEIDLDRNPIKLLTDVPNITGSTWNLINNPDLSSIRDGVAGLFSRFDNRLVGTMNLRYQTFESNTKAELSLRLSGGASYAGFSLENDYQNTTNSTHHNITIDAVKPLYTITCKVPSAQGYFKSGVTIDPAKNPIIISSVTYGIRVLANFNVDTNTKKELDDFKAKYNGIGTTAHVDFHYLTDNAATDQTINCYIVGGSGNSTVAFSKDELEKGLKDLVSGVTYATARPISYEIQDLAGNIIETASETDEITTKKCVPRINSPKLIGVVATIYTGGDNKNTKSHFAIKIKKTITSEFTPIADDISLVMRRDEEYRNDTHTTLSMTVPSAGNTIKYSDFVNSNGGSIRLVFEPDNNNDTWKISSMSFKLIFEGTTKTVRYENFEISDENKTQYFFFDKDFTAL